MDRALQKTATLASLSSGYNPNLSAAIATPSVATVGSATTEDPTLERMKSTVGNFMDNPDYGQWVRLKSLEELQKALVDDLILGNLETGVKFIKDGFGYVEKALRVVELLEQWVMAQVSLVTTAVLMILRKIKNLLLSLQKLLELDILGAGAYVTSYTLPGFTAGKLFFGLNRSGDFQSYTKKVVEQWENHPVATNTLCGMVFVPYGIPIKHGKPLKTFDELMKMMASEGQFWTDLMKRFQDREKDIKRKTNSLNDFLPELIRLVKPRVGVEGIFPDKNTIAERDAKIAEYDLLWKDKIRVQIVDKILAEEAKSIPERRASSMQATVQQLHRDTSADKVVGDAITDLQPYLPDGGYLSTKLSSDNNNYFIVTGVSVAIADPTKQNKFEWTKLYENYGENVVMLCESIRPIFNQLNKLAEYAYDAGIDVINPPDSQSYYKSLALFSSEDLNKNFLGMTYEERFIAYILEVVNAPAFQVLDQIQALLFPKSDDPTNILWYDERYSLSNRSKLTRANIHFDEGFSDIINKISEECLASDLGSSAKKAYLAVTFVDGRTVLFPNQKLDSFNPPTGWVQGTTQCQEKCVAARIKRDYPATKDSWRALTTGSASTEALLREVLPPAVLKWYKKVKDYIADTVELINDLIDRLMEFDSAFKELIQRIRQYMNLMIRLIDEIFEFIKEMLQQRLPVMYIHMWKGDAKNITEKIVQALSSEGLLETTFGGFIAFGEAAFLARTMEAIQLAQKADRDVSEVKKALNTAYESYVSPKELWEEIDSVINPSATPQNVIMQKAAEEASLKLITDTGVLDVNYEDLLVAIKQLTANEASSKISRELTEMHVKNTKIKLYTQKP